MDCEARGKRLLQLVSLVGVEDAQGVEVLAAPDFELDYILAALDLDAPGVLAAGREEEVLDLVDLLPHGGGCCSPSDATLESGRGEGLAGYGGLPCEKLRRQQKRIRVWLPCSFNLSSRSLRSLRVLHSPGLILRNVGVIRLLSQLNTYI